MLVLSRKEGEEIEIGGEIVITITEISGNRASLGITAPRNLRIIRRELKQKEAINVTDGQEMSCREVQENCKDAGCVPGVLPESEEAG